MYVFSLFYLFSNNTLPSEKWVYSLLPLTQSQKMGLSYGVPTIPTIQRVQVHFFLRLSGCGEITFFKSFLRYFHFPIFLKNLRNRRVFPCPSPKTKKNRMPYVKLIYIAPCINFCISLQFKHFKKVSPLLSLFYLFWFLLRIITNAASVPIKSIEVHI